MESNVTQTQGYRISEAPQQSEVRGVEEMSWFKISQLTVDSLLGCLCQEKPKGAIDQSV